MFFSERVVKRVCKETLSFFTVKNLFSFLRRFPIHFSLIFSYDKNKKGGIFPLSSISNFKSSFSFISFYLRSISLFGQEAFFKTSRQIAQPLLNTIHQPVLLLRDNASPQL